LSSKTLKDAKTYAQKHAITFAGVRAHFSIDAAGGPAGKDVLTLTAISVAGLDSVDFLLA
jgi:hypothetical protein